MSWNRPPRRAIATGAAALRTSLVALWIVFSGSAIAQGDDARTEAERHFRAGEQAYSTGQYLAAARAFEESYKLLPIPEIAFSTAQAYRLQYFVDKEPLWLERAITLYRAYIDKKPKGGRRDVAITHLAELEPILLRMKAEGASMDGAAASQTQVLITSPVEGARGIFQGKTGELPMVLDLQPGSYEVSVEAPGHATQKRAFQALEGRFITVEVALAPLPAEVRLITQSGAWITVDGRPEGETPLLGPLEMAHGEHFIAVSKRGHRPWGRQVEVSRGQALDLRADLRITTQRKVSYAFAGAAGASVLAGTVTALLAGKANDQALEIRRQHEEASLTEADLAEYNRLRTQRNNQLGATVVLFGFATLSATVGGLLYYFDNPRLERPPARKRQPTQPKSNPMRELSLQPAVGPEYSGMSVSGRF